MTKDEISRREFLAVAGAAPLSASLASGVVSETKTEEKPSRPSGKLKFSCMVTLEDWTYGAGTWGEVGIRYILRRLADSGFYRVFWRTSGSGQASYPSKIATPISFFAPYDRKKYPEHFKWLVSMNKKPWFGFSTESGGWGYGDDPQLGSQAIDFSNFDSVGIARDMSRKLGMQFWLWHEHAEDHGALGQIGRMGLRHPEWFTMNRDGKASHCRFSMAIPPAMDYRLAWVRELLEYEPDGIYFDFAKSMESSRGVGCTPHYDDKGVWYCTYDKPALEAFKKKTGRDPFKIPNDDDEWVRFRADYMTDFVRRVREMQRSTYPKIKIGLFGSPNGRAGLSLSDKVVPLADPLSAFLEDHETWTRKGLVEEFVNAYTSGIDQKDAGKIKATIADSRSRVQAPCRYLGSQIESYTPKDEKSLAERVEAAAEAGCEEVVFFESTPLQWNNTWDAAYSIIRKYGA
jgi:hypothetical protein